MLVRFLRDFQSKHTGERFCQAGAQLDLDSEAARALIAEGAAEPVPIVAREKQVAPALPVNPPPRKRRSH